jgi:uncharacterized protein YceK
MNRIAVVHTVLVVAMMIVLLAGCSSTPSASIGNRGPVENEIMLAGYQAGEVAGSFESLTMELSMPLWFLSGD